ncbi:Preprotein translocase subunit SecE [Candidatus Portiera aleyrodidarum]|uniref:Protein translocase subunit SecE n=1 Tax=Candidatus Portiera aleyrodidarum TV TaxID=1297582 RepID=A0A8D4BPK8_9GAMM|nr:preprotein translocase subunit SecE [Candidatus Portiera aleyrodidarum]AGI27140.1 preprotein translocase, SecE subunit [Candidatus Portiera aleyrodidarum TV]CEI59112.1 Preprotein translocase subunit SecE [Candidatus Portiera aleyrodidarum]
MIKNKKYDELKWLYSIINILIAIYLLKNNKYIYLLLYSLSIYVMLMTVKGKELRSLGKNAKKEIKRVVWPKKQEIIKTTIVVVLVIFILSIIIWILDTLISGLIAILIKKN